MLAKDSGPEIPRVPSESNVNLSWLGSLPCPRKAAPKQRMIITIVSATAAASKVSTSALQTMTLSAIFVQGLLLLGLAALQLHAAPAGKAARNSGTLPRPTRFLYRSPYRIDGRPYRPAAIPKP